MVNDLQERFRADFFFGLHTIVSKLLGAGYSADAKDTNGQLPLFYALYGHPGWNRAGQKLAIKLLLGHNDVDSNPRDSSGHTPLHKAIYGGRETIVTVMEEHAINVNVKVLDGESPLTLAIKTGDEPTEAARSIIALDDAETNDGPGSGSPLIMTIINDNETVVMLILQRQDLQINTVDENGRPALMWAAAKNCEAIVTSLLRRAEIRADIEDEDGNATLTYAACSQSEAIVRQILQRKDIDSNWQEKSGWSALMFATILGRKEIMKLLLNQDELLVNQTGR